MIPAKETMTVEFKSDLKCLSDKELLEAVVCLASGNGGSIYLGVEDDGTVTGLHANHISSYGLPAMVANRTMVIRLYWNWMMKGWMEPLV